MYVYFSNFSNFLFNFNSNLIFFPLIFFIFKIYLGLQSHLIEEEAGLLLNEGTTIIIGKVRKNRDGTSSAKRLERLDMCRLNESLPDLLDSSVAKELITLTSTMIRGLKELQRSPLGRLTGAFDEWNKYIYV